jgi:Kef-type K+ transport system membrane component KefB
MPAVSFESLLVVAALAVLAPLLLGYAPRLRIPAVVLEIVAGVALGPHGLGWFDVDLPVQVAGILGLAFLLFLAGLEIDLRQLRGPSLRIASAGYALTLVVGLAIGFALRAAGWVDSATLLAIALSATSLGLVVPVLKDAGALGSQVGRQTVVAATVADFAAILLLSLAFSTSGGGAGERLVLLGAFVVLVAVTAVAGLAAGRSMRLGDVLTRLQDTTAEIRVRLAVLLLIGFVVLAQNFGLESILGAFLAGAVVAVIDADSASHPHFRVKLEAIGYGFLIPVFFISSGAKLDVEGLVSHPSALLRVPVYLGALLLVHAVPVLLLARASGQQASGQGTSGRRATIASALLQATSLPFIVTATQIGVATGRMTAVTATALVFAGLLSVLIFPAAALGLLVQPRARAAAPAPSSGADRPGR